MLIKKAGRASQLLGSDSTSEPLSFSVGLLPLPWKIKSRRGRRGEKCDSVSGLLRGFRRIPPTRKTNQRKGKTRNSVRCEKRMRWRKKQEQHGSKSLFYEPFNLSLTSNHGC